MGVSKRKGLRRAPGGGGFPEKSLLQGRSALVSCLAAETECPGKGSLEDDGLVLAYGSRGATVHMTGQTGRQDPETTPSHCIGGSKRAREQEAGTG